MCMLQREVLDWLHVKSPNVSISRYTLAVLMGVLGCKVIATASSETKRAVCKDRAGVDAVVDYTEKDWQVSFRISLCF